MHQSVATIDSPEFINLKPLDINPLMSSCEIKVLYLGENRNHTFISKEVAIEMAKTLRGAPIVGYYKDEKEDYADHGEQIIIDDEGIKFNCLTVPYGFVAPDAKVWFQKFKDIDHAGNEVERDYLMTTGYLWTGQFPECQAVVNDESGRPQSMEIDEKTLEGEWSKNYNSGMEFFIINDGIFSKLCILGEDVEPCFEGSSITKPQISSTFTKVDDNFKRTLFNMMQDLKFALEGGHKMEDNKDLSTLEEKEVITVFTPFTEEKDSKGMEPSTSFVKEKEEKEDKKEEKTSEEPQEESKEDTSNEEKKDKEEKKKDEKYSLLEKEVESLRTQLSEMQTEYTALKEFKAEVENKEKDALIERFYMLDEADKKDIVENKAKYSLEDIEAKLSIIYTKKKLLAEKESEIQDVQKEDVLTYSLNEEVSSVPDWVKAVETIEQEN